MLTRRIGIMTSPQQIERHVIIIAGQFVLSCKTLKSPNILIPDFPIADFSGATIHPSISPDLINNSSPKTPVTEVTPARDQQNTAQDITLYRMAKKNWPVQNPF